MPDSKTTNEKLAAMLRYPWDSIKLTGLYSPNGLQQFTAVYTDTGVKDDIRNRASAMEYSFEDVVDSLYRVVSKMKD